MTEVPEHHARLGRKTEILSVSAERRRLPCLVSSHSAQQHGKGNRLHAPEASCLLFFGFCFVLNYC